MRYVVGCLVGIEDVCKKEIKEKLDVNSKKILSGRLQFDADKSEKLRSIYVIYELIDYFKFENLKDILERVKKLDFSFIKEDFVVRCNKNKCNLNSMEIERKVGEVIFEKKYKVNLKSKLIIYLDIIGDSCFIGKLIAKDLNKRKYRLKRHNNGVDACLAYAMVKLGKTRSIYDPFCRDGVILIEAGLSGIKDLYGMDNENNLRISRINSKLAGVHIKFIKPEKVGEVISCIFGFPANKIKLLFGIAKKVVVATEDIELIKKIAKEKGYKLMKTQKLKSKNIKIAVFKA